MTKSTTIQVFGNTVNVYDYSYDANGNRRQVIWFRSIADSINLRIGKPEYNPLDRTNTEYMHVLNAMRGIGGKKFHNKKFGGGVVFAGAELSTLGKEIETAITAYGRWYMSENLRKGALDLALDSIVCTLPIVVKSTNRGLTVKGEYMNTLELKINVEYDHNITSTENYVRAAMLWCAKAEFKRWQIEGVESTLILHSAYTALDANTRVFMYQIA